jgi:hypothetical protein
VGISQVLLSVKVTRRRALPGGRLSTVPVVNQGIGHSRPHVRIPMFSPLRFWVAYAQTHPGAALGTHSGALGPSAALAVPVPARVAATVIAVAPSSMAKRDAMGFSLRVRKRPVRKRPGLRTVSREGRAQVQQGSIDRTGAQLTPLGWELRAAGINQVDPSVKVSRGLVPALWLLSHEP